MICCTIIEKIISPTRTLNLPKHVFPAKQPHPGVIDAGRDTCRYQLTRGEWSSA
jgi:hypothetical protein